MQGYDKIITSPIPVATENAVTVHVIEGSNSIWLHCRGVGTDNTAVALTTRSADALREALAEATNVAFQNKQEQG